jgi:hypothetical protein
MMMVIALVFFISSFLAASFSNPQPTTTAGTGSVDQAVGTDCFFVRTAEGQYLADCMFN